MATPRFDELIHPSTRLSIVSLLAAADWADFGYLRDQLGLSDSALSKQLSTLDRPATSPSTAASDAGARPAHPRRPSRLPRPRGCAAGHRRHRGRRASQPSRQPVARLTHVETARRG